VTPEERRRRYVESGRRANAASQARIASDIDPDGTLDPDERARLIRERYSEMGRRAAHTRAARKVAAEPNDGNDGPAAPREADTCHGHPPASGPVASVAAERPEVADVMPELLERPEVLELLAARDVAGLYRALRDVGVSQRQIAGHTGQSQSEVSEILKGRQVRDVLVLERIADGLGIPRGLMRLAGAPAEDAYPGDATDAGAPPDEADHEMLRRRFQHFLALAAGAAMGAPVPGVGELADWLTAPGLSPAGRRIGIADVERIQRRCEQVGTLARAYGGQGEGAVALAGWADEWLDAECAETVRTALLSALAHVHTVTAWCCHDIGAVGRAHWHFARALELATEAGDAYQAAYAMRHAAMMLVDRGEPDNGLKIVQFGLIKLGDLRPDDPRVEAQRGECHVVSALALAGLGQGPGAHDALMVARDGWSPPTPHARGCMDLDAAHTHLLLGRLDMAQETAARASRTLAVAGERREGVLADLALARIHVLAGEQRGFAMADQAISAVTEMDSAVARQCWLPPLAVALEGRPGPDARELARRARRVAGTVRV